MEAKQHVQNSALDGIMVTYLDLDGGQTFVHGSAPWDEYAWQEYSTAGTNNHSTQPHASMVDHNPLWVDQSYDTSFQYEGFGPYHLQTAPNLLSISPLVTTLSPPESPFSSPPSTISSSPRNPECSSDLEGHTFSFNFQESVSPFPVSPVNYSFGWNLQSPTFSFDPSFSSETMNVSSPLPTIIVSTPPLSSSTPEITPLTQGDAQRLSSLSPLASITTLPLCTDSESITTSKTRRTTQRLSPSASPSSASSCSSSPLSLSSNSTWLRKSARLASKVGGGASHFAECQSVTNAPRKSSLKRSHEEASSTDDACDSSGTEFDGNYTESENEAIYEPVTHQRSPRKKRSKKHHHQKLKPRKKCPKCPETFTRSADRTRHLAAIHGVNPRSKDEDRCRGCSKYLSRRDSRQRHERKCVNFSRLPKLSGSESS